MYVFAWQADEFQASAAYEEVERNLAQIREQNQQRKAEVSAAATASPFSYS